jgi:pimeloyl-ACP methyl ester carboxylesterase
VTTARPHPPTDRELAQVDAATRTGRPVVVFVHGLWLLAGSWDRWRTRFEADGYATVAVEWPGDPATVAEGRADPGTVAGFGIADITDHIAQVLGRLPAKPALIGHSFGGLLVQKLAGMGLAAATVAIDPAPFRGVLPLPLPALRAAFPVLSHPRYWRGSVMLTYEQFRFGFANAVDPDQARRLYDEYPVPGPGRPIFQAAVANLYPGTEARVDTTTPSRGPVKLLGADDDNTVPWAITHASYKRQRHNAAVTEIERFPGRGHALVIDDGWEDVAASALAFARIHHPPA